MPPKKGTHHAGTFKKGNKANPKGRGATLPILKVFREYSTKVVAEIYTDLIKYSIAQLQAIVEDKNSPALQVIMAQTLIRDKKNNDSHYTEKILTRIIGPIPQVSEFGGIPGGVPLPQIPPQITIIKHEGAPNADSAKLSTP